MRAKGRLADSSFVLFSGAAVVRSIGSPADLELGARRCPDLLLGSPAAPSWSPVSGEGARRPTRRCSSDVVLVALFLRWGPFFRPLVSSGRAAQRTWLRGRGGAANKELGCAWLRGQYCLLVGRACAERIDEEWGYG